MSEWYDETQRNNEENTTPQELTETAPEETEVPAAEEPAVEQPTTPVDQPPAQPPVTPPVQQTPPYYGVPQQPYYRPPYVQQPPVNVPEVPQKKKSNGNVPIIVMAVLCGVCLIGTLVFGALVFTGTITPNIKTESAGVNDSNRGTLTNDDDVNENAPSITISGVPEYDDGGLSTAEIVAKNADSTVMLTMYDEYSNAYNNFYEYYFGYGYGGSDELVEVGSASGIIYSADGYILTNSHCVYNEESQEEYARIAVTLYNGEEYEADIVGYDPTTDLAVIKVDANGLTPAQFGDSSKVNIGDRVVTLGNSGGLAWSASQGILSGQARDVYEDTGYAIKCLQVDAVINPGSSGGPLFNANGQVIGINSAKIVLDGYEGLGFSIPINEAKAVIDDLAKYGYVKNRVSLGITGYTVESIGYEGFMIDSIGQKSSLKGTDAQVGDIIIRVDGERVMNYEEMRDQLTSHNVGDTITLTLLRHDRYTRDTKEFDITVTLQEATN